MWAFWCVMKVAATYRHKASTCACAQAAHCAGSLVQALLEFGAHNYVEFQAVQSKCGPAIPCSAFWQVYMGASQSCG